jgi:two-component system, NarL family, sensor histidine kinase UhpB
LLSAVVNSSMDAIVTIDGDRRIAGFNAAAERMFGTPRADTVGTPLDRFLPGLTHLTSTSDPGARLAIAARRRSGEEFPVEATLSEIEVGDERLCTIIIRDVSARQRADAVLLESREQLRRLALRLSTVREEECTRISREIHDELGQALTALKLDLAWLRIRTVGEVEERLSTMWQLLDGTISAVRRISNDLRPGILDDLGLAAAISWQAEQFATRTGIECRVRILSESLDLGEHRSTTLFRALQEALTNVARHADASLVTIVLHQGDGAVELCVADNGRGFSPKGPARRGGLGLIGMGERARACGGFITIVPRRRRGTILTVHLPLA